MAITHTFEPQQRILERYRLLEVIGKGGVGIVWRALDESTGEAVAVKVLGHQATRNRTARQRMEREAQILGQLHHPHLVHLIDYFLYEDEVPVLVMEYFPGQSLQQLLDQRHHFSLLESAQILRQMLSALSVCHAAGVVHRDLKPGNLLVQFNPGGGLTLRIIDFGIVQLLADPDGATALTLSGELFGSPRYMAPEQWQQRAVDARTDVYAVGLIGYALLTGQHFIQAQNPIEAFEVHFRAPRPILSHSAYGEPIPPAFAAALARAAQPSPDQRYPSVQAFSEEIHALLTASGSWSSVAQTQAVAALPDLDATSAQAVSIGEQATILSMPALSAAEIEASRAAQRIARVPDDLPAGEAETLALMSPFAQEGAQGPSALNAPARGNARLGGVLGEENTAVTRGDYARALRESAGLVATGQQALPISQLVQLNSGGVATVDASPPAPHHPPVAAPHHPPVTAPRTGEPSPAPATALLAPAPERASLLTWLTRFWAYLLRRKPTPPPTGAAAPEAHAPAPKGE